jgi:hypothetical protein
MKLRLKSRWTLTAGALLCLAAVVAVSVAAVAQGDDETTVIAIDGAVEQEGPAFGGDAMTAIREHMKGAVASVGGSKAVTTYEWVETTAAQAVVLTSPPSAKANQELPDKQVYIGVVRGDFTYGGEDFVMPVKTVIVVIDPQTLGVVEVAYRGSAIDTSVITGFKTEMLY